MLLRFLTLATVSMTYLTIQAVSSTETKSERLSATSAFTSEHISELPRNNQIAMMGKALATQSAAPPLPKSFKITILTAKLRNKTSKRTLLKKITKQKKRFVRLAYMPSSYHPDKLKKSDHYIKKQASKPKVSAKQAVKSRKNKSYKNKRMAALKRRNRKTTRGRKPKYSLGARVSSKYRVKKKRIARRKRARRVRYKSVNYLAALSGGVY